MSKLLIKGGRVINPASGFDQIADVLIVDGKVAQIDVGLKPIQSLMLSAKL
jgi:dihydroorotase